MQHLHRKKKKGFLEKSTGLGRKQMYEFYRMGKEAHDN